jgi:hypothetical protein
MLSFGLMEKAALLGHLEEVRKQALRSDGLIEAQRRIVASLAAVGGNTMEAQNILDAMEQKQKLQLAEIDWLPDALDEKASD